MKQGMTRSRDAMRYFINHRKEIIDGFVKHGILPNSSKVPVPHAGKKFDDWTLHEWCSFLTLYFRTDFYDKETIPGQETQGAEPGDT